MRNKVFLTFLIYGCAGLAQAGSPMKQTQDLLKNPEQRGKAIQETPQAKNADKIVDDIVSGSEVDKQTMYELAAEIFGNFEGKTPDEMRGSLEQASKNPQQFYQSLTPEQKKKISELAAKISDSKKKP